MFEIVNPAGEVVDTLDTWHAAASRQTAVQRETLTPHIIRQSVETARTTVSTRSPLGAAWDAGEVVWGDDDVLVTK